jgi:hypothetical protein
MTALAFVSLAARPRRRRRSLVAALVLPFMAYCLFRLRKTGRNEA